MTDSEACFDEYVFLICLLFFVNKALVTVRGTVVCKEKCGASVSVALSSIGGKRNEKTKTISLTDESSEFLFHDVIPGKYRVEVGFFFSTLDISFNFCLNSGHFSVDNGFI